MSNQSGLFVFTATPDLAQALPKVFKAGVTYTVQRASTINQPAASNKTSKNTSSSPKKTTKHAGKTPAKSSKQDEKRAKSAAPKTEGKSSKKKGISIDAVVQFVRDNDGCNMTQIEASTRAPQPILRKLLNDARDAGMIRTEGQRRGLRYFASTTASASTADKSNSSDSDSSDKSW